jgi:hypothetical protein
MARAKQFAPSTMTIIICWKSGCCRHYTCRSVSGPGSDSWNPKMYTVGCSLCNATSDVFWTISDTLTRSSWECDMNALMMWLWKPLQDHVSEIPSALCITLEIPTRAGQEPDGDRSGLGARSFWTFAVEAMRGDTVNTVPVMAGDSHMAIRFSCCCGIGFVLRSCFTKSPMPTLSTGAKAYKGSQVAG